MNGPRSEYERRLQIWRDRIAVLDRVHLRVSNSRLVVAALGAVLLWLVFGRGSRNPLWSAGAMVDAVAFGGLVVFHGRLLHRLERARQAERWYARGLERLNGRWSGKGRNGARFLECRAYARDLDLFGRGSVFELLNTAATEAGEETLAGWISAGAPIGEITARQAAAAELRENVDFREDLAVLSSGSEVSRTGALAAWAAAPGAGLSAFAAAAFGACALVMIAIAAMVFTDRLSSVWLVLWLFVEALLVLAWWRPVRLVLARIATPDHDLALFSDLLARIETEPMAAPRLDSIKAALMSHGVPPSRRIAQLRRLVSWLDSTRNQMFAPIALALLLPQLLAVAIDRWHAAYGPRVIAWLRAVGELEALSAIGTYAFEHPNDPFPVLVEGGPLFEAEALAHPLMLEDSAVANGVVLGGQAPRVIVISGSNMSGKSTLLRSVGVNVVLALAGAPVRASRLRLSPLLLGATLRIEDSLQEGHSRFYAEILRVRDIVNQARASTQSGSAACPPTLFLLDEILHGTNSYDRRIGAEAIVRALVGLGAIGLVTTHDLALTELPATLGPIAVNMHFEDRLEGDTMTFDYHMRPGVVEHSNALALMRAVGLDV